MTILAVLENEAAVAPFMQMTTKLAPEAELLCFGNPLPALAAARKRRSTSRSSTWICPS